jgi:hypothetical protein
MKNAKAASLFSTVMSVISCIGLSSYARAQAPHEPAPSGRAETQAPAPQDAEAQRKAYEQRARPSVEKQRRQAEQQAAQSLDKDAAAAVAETQNALKALAANNPNEAMAAIERATGKINVLLARNPAAALIPLKLEVDVIDVAPSEREAIRGIVRSAEKAMGDRDYPSARALLSDLASEIRIKTYNLPLATYPAALREAARLFDQKQTREAQGVLAAALDTLAVVTRVQPLPLVVAQAAIEDAQALRDKDKAGARRLLAVARAELDRAKELGYASNDPEYAALGKEISDLDAQLERNEDTGSTFARLRDRVAAFFKRQSESEHR